ncbi:SH3 domain-containing protein [Streptomyces sp. NPDC057555]|uniref:SH3 domain-containing protein n=1 Tax=Streptomyces sp. NPDC057555 TaxID=3346166 RepID=UPI003686052B
MTTQEFQQDGTADTAGEPVPLRASLAASSYPVAAGYRVNVRQGPGTNTPMVRQLPVGAQITIRCQQRGEWVTGPCGTTNIWDSIGPGQYVSDAYVRTGSSGMVAPSCMS